MATIVPDVGLNRAAAVIGADVTHIAVGTSTTAPTSVSTTLVAESDRLAPSNRIYTANETQIRSFFPNANLPTTVEEVGAFMNGTGTPDSGEPVLLHNLTFTKGTQDLYLVIKLTVVRP